MCILYKSTSIVKLWNISETHVICYQNMRLVGQCNKVDDKDDVWYKKLLLTEIHFNIDDNSKTLLTHFYY